MNVKYRIARGWFGRTKVVVQVPELQCSLATGQKYIFWRDATESDIDVTMGLKDDTSSRSKV